MHGSHYKDHVYMLNVTLLFVLQDAFKKHIHN